MPGMSRIKFAVNYCLKIDDRAILSLRRNFETYEPHGATLGLYYII
jgi:hypothetical protein